MAVFDGLNMTEIRTQRTKGHYLRERRWVVKFSAMVLGFITTSMLHPPRRLYAR